MPSFKKRCEHCGTYYDAYLDRSRFCSGSCRVKAHKAAQTRRMALLQELLAEQTAAIESGADATVLLEIQRRAKRLLGD